MDTTSKMRGLHPNGEMSFIGYTIAAILVVGMLPLLPFFLLWLLVDRITSGGEQPRY
ncbi:DUF7535 family protein [Halosimplex amylolyticum]|uniref:DUF7535 family protein n=1 Tax=Halosimplex amylolyticum TaxID=3396616 RepID=UPI003F55CB6C